MSQANVYEQYLLELINVERAKAGVQPLAMNGDLNESAELHSQWMLSADVFSHTGSGGSTFTARMTSAGYNLTGSWWAGENIAWGSLRSPAGYIDEVQLLHTALMNSSGHRANILKADYREVGLGFELGQFKTYQAAMLTEDFAKSGTSAFLLGVAFDDKDGDHFYDPGEQLAGVTVTATNSSGASGRDTPSRGESIQACGPAAGFAPNMEQPVRNSKPAMSRVEKVCFMGSPRWLSIT